MSEQISRRSAVRGALVAALGGVAGFALARTSPAARQRRGTTAANAYGAGSSDEQRPLARLDAIPSGGGTVLRNPAVVLVRTAAGQVHAYSAICTHQGCPVTRVANGTIDCPCHGSRFDASSGRVVAGPASRPLPRIQVVVRAGEVYRA